MTARRGTPLKEALERALLDPAVRKEYEALGPSSDLIMALVKLRSGAGLTQEQLAERIGTKRAYITRIEGKPANLTLRTLARIAGAVDADLVLRFEPAGETPPIDVRIPASRMAVEGVLDRFE